MAQLIILDSRTPWQGDPESLARIKTSGKMNEEGYINVGDQLGLSGARGTYPLLRSLPFLTADALTLHVDYSSYHQPWVRRQFGRSYW